MPHQAHGGGPADPGDGPVEAPTPEAGHLRDTRGSGLSLALLSTSLSPSWLPTYRMCNTDLIYIEPLHPVSEGPGRMLCFWRPSCNRLTVHDLLRAAWRLSLCVLLVPADRALLIMDNLEFGGSSLYWRGKTLGKLELKFEWQPCRREGQVASDSVRLQRCSDR